VSLQNALSLVSNFTLNVLTRFIQSIRLIYQNQTDIDRAQQSMLPYYRCVTYAIIGNYCSRLVFVRVKRSRYFCLAKAGGVM